MFQQSLSLLQKSQSDEREPSSVAGFLLGTIFVQVYAHQPACSCVNTQNQTHGKHTRSSMQLYTNARLITAYFGRDLAHSSCTAICIAVALLSCTKRTNMHLNPSYVCNHAVPVVYLVTTTALLTSCNHLISRPRPVLGQAGTTSASHTTCSNRCTLGPSGCNCTVSTNLAECHDIHM